MTFPPGATFPKDTWVVQIRGKQRGRVGRVAEHPSWVEATDGTQIGRAQVQFRSSGPFQTLKFSSLRLADENEIPKGVG